MPEERSESDQQQATELRLRAGHNVVLHDERIAKTIAAARAEEAARWRAKIEEAGVVVAALPTLIAELRRHQAAVHAVRELADSLIRDARTDRSTVVWIAEQFRAAVAALDPKEQADE